MRSRSAKRATFTTAPSASRIVRAASQAAVQPSGATGSTPKPARASASSTSRSTASTPASVSRPMRSGTDAAGVNEGSSRRMPATRPATSRAIGPTVSRLGASGHTPSSETRPCVVFRPATPQHAAGVRIDPPVSDPNATSASSSATATADPLDDPPGMTAGSSGLRGVPYQRFTPLPPIASSTRFVLPTMRAPAARAPARQRASRVARIARSATTRLPAVVASPSTSMRSFTASRNPEPGATSSLVMNVAGSPVTTARAQRPEKWALPGPCSR